jgi:dTDP-4-dehydrorhamnose 3,5-epimerase
MAYEVTPTTLPDVLVLRPQVFSDQRGFFYESFNARDFKSATGIERTFVQDNQSHSVHGVLRGLHYQIEHPQGKLVRVTRGEVFDVAVDIRRGSPTFLKWAGVTLSAENRHQMWIPEGFAHGFLVTGQSAEVTYKVTDYWHAEHERCLKWNDPEIGVQWPLLATPPLLAAKDANATGLRQCELFP